MHKRYLQLAGGMACAAIMTASPALAEDKLEWSITIAGTSDYIFRGISLSEEDPAFQPSINFSYGIFYFGAWGSNIEGEGYEPWETDLYAGITPTLGPVTFDFGAVYYWYANGSDTNYVELKAGASVEPVKGLSLKPVFWYTPDQDNYAETWTIEGTVAYELPAIGIFTPTVSGLYGYSEDVDNVDAFGFGVPDYTYWNAGVALAVEKFTFDFRYWDTDIDAPTTDERFVFTASVTLP